MTLASGDTLYDQLLVIGGRVELDFDQDLDANERFGGGYDWTRGASLPTPRSGIAAVAFGERLSERRIYVFGGEWPTGAFDTVEAYDPVKNS